MTGADGSPTWLGVNHLTQAVRVQVQIEVQRIGRLPPGE